MTTAAIEQGSPRRPVGVCAPHGVSEGRSVRPRPCRRDKLVALDAVPLRPASGSSREGINHEKSDRGCVCVFGRRDAGAGRTGRTNPIS